VFLPLIQRGNSGRPGAMPNYPGFYGIIVETGPMGYGNLPWMVWVEGGQDP